jgi:vitamin B12 transporter
MNVAGAHFQNLLTTNIERIEVLRGAQSGIWGSGAVAGVINIITQKAGEQVHVVFEKGTHNTQRLSATLGAGNDQADFVVSFNNLTSDGFSAVKAYKESDNGLERDAFDQTDVLFKMGIIPSDGQRVEFMAKQITSATEYDSATDPDASGILEYQHQQRQIQHTGEWSKLSTRLFAQQNISETSFSEGSLNKIGALINYQYTPNNNIAIALDQSDYRNELDSKHNYNNQGAGFNSINQFFNQKFIVNLNGRTDRYTNYENKTTGAIGLKYYVMSDLFISANAGSAYRAPSLAEITYTSVGSLKPETKQGLDIGFGWKGLEVNYYESEIETEIGYDMVAWTYKNQEGKSKYQGIEASFTSSINALKADLKIGFTQQTAKDDDGKWLARRPEQQANISLDFYGLTKTRLGLETRYIGKTYDKADQQGAQIGEYFVTDLTADYQLTKHVSLYGKVQNLVDEDYIPAVAAYETNGITPSYVYGNGGTQFFVGIRGKL